MTSLLGMLGEEIAREHLSQQGLRIIEKNYTSKLGEIDIVALDGRSIVFVEVKTRKSKRHGHPLESITPKKQKQIIKAAKCYIKEKRLSNCSCRFDAVGIFFNKHTNEPEVTYVRGAFDAE